MILSKNDFDELCKSAALYSVNYKLIYLINKERYFRFILLGIKANYPDTVITISNNSYILTDIVAGLMDCKIYLQSISQQHISKRVLYTSDLKEIGFTGITGNIYGKI